MTIFKLISVATLVFFLLAGCGGGGATAGNTSITANAGVAQEVSTGSVVTLDGSGSSGADGRAVSYSWTFFAKPDGSSAGLSNSSAVNPSFIPDVAGTYIISLVISDGAVTSVPSTVSIKASAANIRPAASAGAGQNVATGIVVMLDGSSSNDANGDPLTYRWTMTSKPDGSTAQLSYRFYNRTGYDYARPMVTPDVAGVYVVSLVVNDGKAESVPSVLSITAKQATVVTGILTEDTTLTKSNSPYSLGDVQVLDGVTLTIAPGVALYGNGVTVWGTLKAVGTADERIAFNNVYIEQGYGAIDSQIEIAFADVAINNKPSFSENNASVSITDSTITTSGTRIVICNSKHDSHLERNTLVNTSVTVGAGASPVYIRNNNFKGSSQVLFRCSNSPVYVQYNTFMTMTTQVIRLADYCESSGMLVANDYWGTTDTSKIEAMIFDHKDYYPLPTLIEYLPVLTSPDPNTPAPAVTVAEY